MLCATGERQKKQNRTDKGMFISRGKPCRQSERIWCFGLQDGRSSSEDTQASNRGFSDGMLRHWQMDFGLVTGQVSLPPPGLLVRAPFLSSPCPACNYRGTLKKERTPVTKYCLSRYN